ncbi:hypothetical protein NIES4075_64690 [Tolypothrix sp. NIES-4075]|uniref:hypothetical protein n=1 Tax=Tolypothrix sp. NIES-4075 TaxID=2005459 RepID=UPI000B5C1F70|nr:hypothetical protein [Tolypothrix sp. NIES-4075]GAX45448.1 hypothetical protein NIES4075_64690 [Tolypothrix sp. NIES-4075]
MKGLRIGQVGEVPQFVFVNPTSMILVDEWVVRSLQTSINQQLQVYVGAIGNQLQLLLDQPVMLYLSLGGTVWNV